MPPAMKEKRSRVKQRDAGSPPTTGAAKETGESGVFSGYEPNGRQSANPLDATEPELRRLLEANQGQIVDAIYEAELQLQVSVPVSNRQTMVDFAAGRTGIQITGQDED